MQARSTEPGIRNSPQQIEETIDSIVKRSRFYQELYSGLHSVNYQSVPYITKADLLEDQRKYPPFGSNLSVGRSEIRRIHRTSGTTVNPLLVVLTSEDEQIVIKAGARAFKTAGVSENDIVVNCMNYCMWMGGLMDHLSLESAGAAVVPYGVGQTENLISLLFSLENPSIHATPSYLSKIREVLKEKFDKTPKDLGLVKGLFGGESGLQDDSFRNSIESEWGMTAINANYGLSEVISILGSECQYRQGLHFTAEDYLHVDVIDADLKPLALQPGTKGELVVTTLQKQAQPLIKYRTGDVLEIVNVSTCPCGETSFTFKLVGRTDDMLVIKGINFFPETVRPILKSFPALTGAFTVVVPDKDPIEEITLVLECKDFSNSDALIMDISTKVKNSLYFSPRVILEESISWTGNKRKLVQRTSNAQI